MTVERLQEWEEGSLAPTYKQLQTMAEKYRRPVAVLYLPSPPKQFDALREYRRSLQSDGVDLPYELVTELERIRIQQDVLQELYELDERAIPSLGLAIHSHMSVEEAAAAIRDWLPLRPTQQQHWAKAGSLVTRLSELIEAHGIIVAQVQRVPLRVMRGCAVSDHRFPAIVLNGADATTGKVFTLIHELVHILLRSGGETSVVPVTRERLRLKTALERFCNQVSAAVLIPRDAFSAESRIELERDLRSGNLNDLESVAAGFGVSPEALLLRMITLGRAEWDDYDALRGLFRQREEREKGPSADLPMFYQLKVRDLGKRYISEVVSAYNRQDISISDMAGYLSVKVSQVPKLIQRLGGVSS